MAYEIPDFFLKILVCPEDKQSLWLIDAPEELCFYNPRLHRKYRIEDGIPVLLIDEAVSLSPEEESRLEALIAQGHGKLSAQDDQP